MSNIFIKNVTSEIIEIEDLSITLPPSGEIDLKDYCDVIDVSVSNDILPLVSNGKLIVNDGIRYLNISESIRHLTGNTIVGATDRQSGKLRVHQTSRQFGTRICFTGASDDPSTPKELGTGERFIFEHKVGEPLTITKYFDFNTYMNETYIHEAYVSWSNTKFDYAFLDFVSAHPIITTGTNTNYNLYNNYLIVPAAGNGTIDITSDITPFHGGLFECKENELGKMPQGFWNADGNIETGMFENITPAPNGDGKFNMFADEIHLARLGNKIPFLDNGFIKLQSSDIDIMPNGLRMKITMTTYVDENNPDHDWSMTFMLVLHRKSTTYIS